MLEEQREGTEARNVMPQEQGAVGCHLGGNRTLKRRCLSLEIYSLINRRVWELWFVFSLLGGKVLKAARPDLVQLLPGVLLEVTALALPLKS